MTRVTNPTQQEQCKAVFEIGDDHGDNSSTHRCQLPKGHSGQHEESWNGRPFGGTPMPATLRWGRVHPLPAVSDNTIQCHTCKHEGTRACIYHGYTELPKSCPYKLGRDAEYAMKNLNNTFIDCWTPEHDAAVTAQARASLLADILKLIAESSFLQEGVIVVGSRDLVARIQSLRQPKENTGSTGGEKR